MNERRHSREGNAKLVASGVTGRNAAGDIGLAPTIIVRGLVDGQQVFKRYILRKELGRGAMGVVWLAWDNKLEREVALKFLPELVRTDPGAIDELKRETRRSLQLTHPNIVRVYDFLEDDSSAAIAMEYIDGATLSALRVEREGRCFDVPDIEAWVKDLCSALHFAHCEAKVVHRDLKPANLMIDRSGRLKVTDFGIARSISDSVSRVSVCVSNSTSGSLAYMSPEQAMGGAPLASDDVYSIGVTIYELLTGKTPFHSGDMISQLREKIPPRIEERRAELGLAGSKIPEVWEDTVAACLAKKPEQRPPNAAEIWRLLESKQARAIGEKPRKPFKLSVLATLALIGALCLVAGWSAWRLHNQQLKRDAETQAQVAKVRAEEMTNTQEEERNLNQKAEPDSQARKAQAEDAAKKQQEELDRQQKAEAEAQAAKAQAEETAKKQQEELDRKQKAEAQAAKAQAEETARKQQEELDRKQKAKAQAEETARKQQEELDRKQKAEAQARAAKAEEEIERKQEEARRQQQLEKERQLQEAQSFAAAKAELLANQEKLLQIAIANASWEAADELSAKLLEGGLPADRLGGYLRAIAKGRMEQEFQRNRQESSPPDLPTSGFFDLDAVFATGPFAAYTPASKERIFKAAQNRLKTQNFYQMEADGIPGAETQKSLIAFQRQKSMPVSGRLDLPTVEALGLSGSQEAEPTKRPPEAVKKLKPRPKSSQSPSPRTAKVSPPVSRAADSPRSAKPAAPPSRPSPPSPVDVILGP